MNKQFGKKILAVLAAAAIPFTTMISSAPLVANAASNDVTFDTTTSSVVSSGTYGSTTINGRNITKDSGGYLDYKYTGNIFTAKSSLYDYLSDNEVNGFSRYSEAAGYADAYTYFNDAISGQLVSPSSENLTIRYEDDKEINRNFKVYLYNSQSNQNNGWPGVAMQNRGEPHVYTYTVKYSDLGFNPDRIIISAENDDSGEWHGSTISRNLVKGKCYSILKDTITEGKAADIYNRTGSYDVPLYFGCFYLDDDSKHPDIGDEANHYQDYNKADGTYKGRTHTNYYNNFYWQANLSLRKDNQGKVNFDASVQGLVDKTLTNGTITQNGKILPYFSDDWADSHSNLVKYWHNIAFPFYEIEVDANKVYGDGGTGKAKYYQFNSKEGKKYSLYFQADDAKKTGTYKETKTEIVSQPTTTDSNGTISYLPFNNKNEYEKNALGFGMNFEMDFQIRADGKVDTYDRNTGKPTGKSVNATFEFMGDDDVWVFIDDKLVLDLGGDHKDTTGIIDFAEGKAYANDAITLGDGKGKDDLSGNLSSQKIVNLKNVMTPDTFTANGKYNEEKVHTLRMFYMERGMYESDLLVRFNFSAINNNNLKIREITEFKDINPGLIDLTKQAADYDVFNYTVSNEGTAKKDVGDSGIANPTYNYYQRQNEANKNLTANLTGKKPVVYDTVTFPNILLDTNKILDGNKRWDEGVRVGAWIWKSGSNNPHLYVGVETSPHVYEFSGFPSDSNKVIFGRIDKIVTCDPDQWPGDDYFYNRTEMSFEPGYTYIVDGWDNSINKASKVADEQVIHYNATNNFIPASTTEKNPVANTDYVWTDKFAVKTEGNLPDGMAGTTNGSGSFNLMYGTSDKESSGKFNSQFKKGSYMYVKQNDSLKTVERDGNVEDFSSTKSRTVSEYYDTTVSIVDKEGYAITNGGTVTDTNYSYSNTSAVPAKDPVQITETFTNTPKVGAISISKRLDPVDLDDKTDFVFTLKLTDVFGISDIDVEDYSGIQAVITNQAGTVVSTTALTNTKNGGQFTLRHNQTLNIYGIPYGTKYSVVETVPEFYSQKSNTHAGTETVLSGTVNTDGTVTPNSANVETVVNSRLLGSLTINKKLAGDYKESDKDLLFYIQIELKLPDSLGDPHLYGISELTGSPYFTYENGVYTTRATVSYNQPYVLSNIPCGTQYTVFETETNALFHPDWTSSGTVKGMIGETAAIETITNTYTPPAVGSLKVSKTVVDSDGSDIDSDEEFYFSITLKDTSGKPISGSFEAVYYVNGVKKDGNNTLGFDLSGVADLALKDNEIIVISNLPAGSLYTVVEAANAAYDTSFDSNKGSVKKDTTSEVNFINKKKFIPYTLPESGFEDARMYFIFALSGMMLFGLAYWYVNREKVKKN